MFLKYEFRTVLLFPLITRASPSVFINKQPLTVEESTLAVFPEPVPNVVALAPFNHPTFFSSETENKNYILIFQIFTSTGINVVAKGKSMDFQVFTT